MELNNIIGPSFHGREYSIGEMIGKGSFGYVYKARQVDGKYFSPALQNQPLALKMYHYSNTSFQGPILNEIIQMMSISRSPHSVQFFDRSPPDEKPEYLVMEYIPETMDTRLEKLSKEHTTHELIKLYLQQMPSIMETLWNEGIIHGDLKRSNIGIKEGYLKLLDFGLARSRTFPGAIPKRRIFYPLEAAEGPITPSLDVYCAGKIIEYALTEKYAVEVPEIIETIEFFHDISLPVSWHRLLRAMLHPHHEKRPNPKQLCQLMGNAASDMDTFQFKDFVPLSKAELLPSSSSSFLPG